MVIWLFAGGGESELGEREGDIKGIVCFFEKHFSDFNFERITPVRNKRTPDRVKSNSAIDALGKTGEAFAKQIKAKLDDKIKYSYPPDAILIVDDLDCCCNAEGNRYLMTRLIRQEMERLKKLYGLLVLLHLNWKLG